MIKLFKHWQPSIILWVLFYILIFGLLLKNTYSYLDPDLGWHLKIGQEISENGVIPRANIYNYTYTGDWVDHEWLIDWVTFYLFTHLGYEGLSLIFVLLIILAIAALHIFIKKFYPRTNPIAIAIVFLLGLIAAIPSFGIRMQELSFLFLTLEMGLINSYYYKNKTKLLFLLIPLLYLWANIHGSFLFGLSLLLLFFIYIIIVEKRSLKNNLFLLGIILLATLSTALTPYGLELFTFLKSYNDSFYLTAISEWLPFYYFPIMYEQLIYLFFLLAAWIIYIYKKLTRKEGVKIDKWQLILVILFIFIALKSRRNVALAVAVTGPFLVEIISQIVDFKKLKTFLETKTIYFLTIACLVLTIGSLLLNTKTTKQPFNSYCNIYPCQAVNFLLTKPEYKEKKIFNEYSWGGYLLWKIPNQKIFIDGRLPQIPFENSTFLEEYLAFFKKEADKQKYLDKHRVEIVLLKTKEDRWLVNKWEIFFFQLTDKEFEKHNYLKDYLDSSPLWQKIYQDSTATLYLRS